MCFAKFTSSLLLTNTCKCSISFFNIKLQFHVDKIICHENFTHNVIKSEIAIKFR